ncbi:MAG: AI-2E family transporter, partial [Bdellovibrionales bacterium]
MRPTDRQLQLKHQQWVKMISFVLLLLSFFLGIILIENLLLSFVISIILGFLISPLVIYVERAGISPIVSILFVYCFFSILTGIFIWEITPFLVNQFVTLKSQLPDYVDRTVRLFEELAHTLDVGTGGVLQVNLSDRLRLWLENQSTALVSGIPQVISSSASVLFLSPILGFFILKDGRSFSRELLKLVPNNIFELILSLQSQIIEQIAHYIRARLIESIIVGLVTLL